MISLRALATLAVILAAAATVGLTTRWAVFGRPDPAMADRQAILRWLATADVQQEPPEFQAALVDRLENELRGGLPVTGAASVGASYQARLSANAAVLKERWFGWRVEQFHALPAAQRGPFLEERIQTVLAWAKLDAALEAGATAPTNNPSVAGFFDEIAGWMRAEPDTLRRQWMQAAVQDGLVHWLATRDLAEQSPQLRGELSLRIAGQLNAGLSLEGTLGQRPAAEHAMLRSNGQLLMEAWLLAQAQAYFQLAAALRPAFIDARWDEVQRWGVMDLLAADSEPSASPTNPLLSFLTMTEQWIQRAPPAQQSQLRELMSAVHARLLACWLQGLRGG